jgi:hypothetical protein
VNMSFSHYVESIRISELKSVQCRHLRKHGNLKISVANEP